MRARSQATAERDRRASASTSTSLRAGRRRRRRSACADGERVAVRALRHRLRRRDPAPCARSPASTLDDLDFDEPWLVVDVLVNERGLAQAAGAQRAVLRARAAVHLVIGPSNHRRWEISLKDGERSGATPRPPPERGSCSRAGSRPTTASCGARRAIASTRWSPTAGAPAASSSPATPRTSSRRSSARACARAIRDVANLAWKLDAVLQGPAPATEAARQLRRRAQGARARADDAPQGDRRRDRRTRSGARPRTRRAPARRGRRRGQGHAAPGRAAAPGGRRAGGIGHAGARHAVSAAVAARRARRAAHGRRRRLRLAPVLDLAPGAAAGRHRRCRISAPPTSPRWPRPMACWRPGSIATAARPRWCGPTTTSSARRATRQRCRRCWPRPPQHFTDDQRTSKETFPCNDDI